MQTTRAALHLLFLLPWFAQAQDFPTPPLRDHALLRWNNFENAQDSTDFTQFRNGLQPTDPALPPDTATIQYRLMWRENQYGNLWPVTRGDGSLMKAPEHPGFTPYLDTRYHYLTAEGRRAVVLVQDIPCGLICRSVWYYVEV